MQIKFENNTIKNVIEKFLDKNQILLYSNFKLLDAYKVIELLPTDLKPTSITWDYFLNIFKKGENEKIQQGICRLFFLFIKNNCYNGEFPEVIETYKTRRSLTKELYWLFSNELSPFNLIVIENNQSNTQSKFEGCYKNDCITVFLSDLLKSFLLHNQTGRINHYFYGNFQASLNGKKINKITDFNADTFRVQYYFYKSSKNSSNLITLLKKFYLFLLDSPEGNNIFGWRDGIDRNMLQSQSFNRNYEEGFILIPLNPFDPVPNFDKWLVMPNGNENQTTKINRSSYKPVDFSNIKDSDLKLGIKHWFWHSTVSLSARIDQANICVKFANFIFDLRNEHNIRKLTGNSTYDLMVEEIFSYIQFIKSNKYNNTYISVVRSLLIYFEENALYKVDPGVYKYLTTQSVDSKNTSKDIPDGDLLKLEKLLKEKSQENYLYTLYYIIFHIAIATEFRISQIINLKIDCLVPGVKKEYYLVSNTKVSNGKEVKIPITHYTKRYIETAKRHTQDVRNACNNTDVKNHIFIHNNSTFQFKVISTRAFSDYLKRCCEELGIEKYTAQNLRDTYMTKAIEYAIKRNLTDLETRVLTFHKRIDTTTNHYVVEQIKEYLEATHMVIIGNPVIKGTIVDKTNYRNEDIVNEECGYCSKESCVRKDDNVDCLLCNGFIATLDRIPYFEEKIANLDRDIKNTNLQTEKERLGTIKRLYLAYLAELLALKEKTL